MPALNDVLTLLRSTHEDAVESLAEHPDSVTVTADDVHVEFLDSFQQLLRRDFIYESV